MTWRSDVALGIVLTGTDRFSDKDGLSGERALLLIAGAEAGTAEKALPEPLAQAVEADRAGGRFAGRWDEVRLYPTYGAMPYRVVALAGTFRERTPLTEGCRLAAAHGIRAIIGEGLTDADVALDAAPLGAAERAAAAQAAAEGVWLGAYKPKAYRRESAGSALALSRLRLVASGEADAEALRAALERAHLAGDATNYARDLTNEPANKLTPAALADEAMRLALQHGLTCDVLDETRIEELGMGGLLAVGRGSALPPRMIVIKYQGLPEWGDALGLVGKGITFDTGGISMKKPDGMEEMISDMGGAAVVLAAMGALAELKPKLNVVAVIPTAENMVSSNAYRPGDIVTTMSGRTVEVLNTDAEGRIVLAEGVTYALQLGATRIIDVATLTGAVLIALGDVATAALTNDSGFLAGLLQAADEAGEKLWELPSYPDYWDMLKSSYADIRNSTGANRWAGSITAGLFVGVFAEGVPWIHIDTGGTAWLWGERGVDPVRSSGSMVRTLIRFLENESAKG